MKPRDWNNLIKTTNEEIVVKFTEDVNDGPDKNMLGKIIDVEFDGVFYNFLMDISDFRGYNLIQEKRIWLDNKGNPTLKWSETTNYPSNGLVEVSVFALDNYTPFKPLDEEIFLLAKVNILECIYSSKDLYSYI